jgi:hypothetical protein
MAGLSKRAPKTFGELRKVLAELGEPWIPDPSISDDEPIRAYPTGGDGVYQPPDAVLPEGGVIEAIQRLPPTNPDLRAEWVEEGLLGELEGAAPGAKRSRAKAKPTPAPDSGG